MDGTKITRQLKGWTNGELYSRHESNSLEDRELNGRHENNSPKGWTAQKYIARQRDGRMEI